MTVEAGYVEGVIVAAWFDANGAGSRFDVRQLDGSIVNLFPTVCRHLEPGVIVSARRMVNQDDATGVWVDKIEVVGFEEVSE